jgi:tRNA threonylcarbamoyladenosine biosynthesis protein TsaE
MTEDEGVTMTVSTSAQMRALGRSLAALLRAGDLVILSGGLGAGKTTLTQGIGEGLGVRGPITSPTFVIARVHPPVRIPGQARAQALLEPRPALVHADAYRLGSVLELDDLDLDTDTASSVTVVEWGEGLAEGLATDRLEIIIKPAIVGAATATDEGETDPGGLRGAAESYDADVDAPRTVLISAVGERWEGVDLPIASLPYRL